MTDYTKLVKALRDTDFGDACDYCEHSDMCKDDDCIILQSASAIEDLQAELEKKRTADCWGCKCEKLEQSDRLQKRGKPVLLAALPMNGCEQLPKRGEWKTTDAFPHRVYCSNCFRTYVPNDRWQIWVDKPGEGGLERNYCPSCGAKMEAQDGNK